MVNNIKSIEGDRSHTTKTSGCPTAGAPRLRPTAAEHVSPLSSSSHLCFRRTRHCAPASLSTLKSIEYEAQKVILVLKAMWDLTDMDSTVIMIHWMLPPPAGWTYWWLIIWP